MCCGYLIATRRCRQVSTSHNGNTEGIITKRGNGGKHEIGIRAHVPGLRKGKSRFLTFVRNDILSLQASLCVIPPGIPTWRGQGCNSALLREWLITLTYQVCTITSSRSMVRRSYNLFFLPFSCFPTFVIVFVPSLSAFLFFLVFLVKFPSVIEHLP